MQKNSSETLPKMPWNPHPGLVRNEYVRCGKSTCRCSHGHLHGPYQYHYWRDGGRLQKRYLKPGEVQDIETRCQQHRIERQQLRLLRQMRGQGMQEWRSLMQQLEATFDLMEASHG